MARKGRETIRKVWDSPYAQLVEGRDYIFYHKRKGQFRAIFKGIVRAQDSDVQDKFFLACLIDTSEGSGKPHLARTKGAGQTLTNIRPSLLLSVDEAPKYQPPTEQVASPVPSFQPPKLEAKQDKSFFATIKRFLKGE